MLILEQAGSTNRILADRIRSGAETPHGYSVLALSQTAGRGRLGRTFSSPRGGLYMSVALSVRPEYIRLVTPMAAVAVRSAIISYTGINTGIKWVNDLYLQGRKVAGILAEYVEGRTVLGIGVNFSTPLFPDEIKDKAGALYPSGAPEGKCVEALAAEIESCVLELCDSIGEKKWLEVYRGNEILTGQDVRIVVPDGEEILHGRAAGVDDDGCLLVLKEDGSVVHVSSGEVSARLK